MNKFLRLVNCQEKVPNKKAIVRQVPTNSIEKQFVIFFLIIKTC